MLKNGSFEGTYTERGFPEIKVAPGWEPFHQTGLPPERDVRCGRPEFTPITRREASYRVLVGDKAQCWFVRWRVMDAGIYQRITNLPANTKFSIYAPVQAWCSQHGDPRVSDGELYFRLGIDLDGDTDPWNSKVIWTDWVLGTADYQELSISGFTLVPNLTVFIRAWNKWELSHNDAYVDGVYLTLDTPPTPSDATYWRIMAENLERWAADIRAALGG